jgi:hypothetical protein
MLPYGNIIGFKRENQAKDSRSGTIDMEGIESGAMIPARDWRKDSTLSVGFGHF